MGIKLRSLALLTLLALLFSLVACGERSYEHCEIGIRLGSDFSEYDSDGRFDMSYSDGRVVIGVLRFSFEACLKGDIPITMSDYTFAKYYRNRAGEIENVTEVALHGYLPYFSYTLTGEGNVEYRYVATFYTTPNAYFLVMYITPESILQKTRGEISELIEKVYFKAIF